MDQKQIELFIAEKTNEGMSLAAIQDALAAQGVKMRFAELRMLAAGIDSVLRKKEEEKQEAAAKAAAAKKQAPDAAPAAPAPSAQPEENPQESFGDGAFDGEAENDGNAEEAPEPPPAPASEPPAGNAPRGKTSVTLSPIQRPGFLASGSVTFGSGVTAEWFLDQTGRIGLENASGQPDREDIRDFQTELRKVFGA